MTTTPTIWHSTQRANTTDSGPGGDDQTDSKIVQLANGNFLVLWTSNTDAGAGAGSIGSDIIAQLYDPEGKKIGGEFRASKSFTVADGEEFAVAARPDGGFALIFEVGADEAGWAGTLSATVWEADLATNYSFDVADPGANDLGSPAVSMNDDGSFIVGYQQTGEVSAISRIVVVSPDLVNGPPVTLVGGSKPIAAGQHQVDSAHLTNNTTVLVGRHNIADDAISLLILNDEGGALTPIKIVADTDANGGIDLQPAVAAVGDGFVVAWANTDSNDTDIEYQRYDAAGNTLGGVGTAGSTGITENNRAPAIIGLDDGGFFLAWDNNKLNTIEGQRYSAGGIAIGGKVTIDGSGLSQTTSEPNLALLQDGRVAVSWTNLRTNAGAFDRDIDFAIYDPRESSLSYGAEAEAITGTRRIEASTINAGGGNDTVYGQGVSETLNGNGGNDSILGGSGADVMNGGGGSDSINGGLGADTLLGAAGNDFLSGGAGKDTLNGGAGTDAIVFDTAIIAAEADAVQAFSVAEDTIRLDNSIFVGLTDGVLAASAFRIGPAQDANDRIVYLKGSGGLFFDPDGSGAGAAVKFAALSTGLALSNADFLVI